MTKRAGLYARVSTSVGQDIGLQRDELLTAASARGFEPVLYEDEGVSGAKASRPALDRLLDDVHAGRLHVVLVWKLDRLARSLPDLLRMLDAFSAAGVGFVSLRDPGLDTTTAAGRLMIQILGAFAEFERGLIQERVVAGVRRAQAAGKHCGRPKKEASSKALEAARMLRAQGWGWRAVAQATGIQKDTLRRRLQEADGPPVIGADEPEDPGAPLSRS